MPQSTQSKTVQLYLISSLEATPEKIPGRRAKIVKLRHVKTQDQLSFAKIFLEEGRLCLAEAVGKFATAGLEKLDFMELASSFYDDAIEQYMRPG